MTMSMTKSVITTVTSSVAVLTTRLMAALMTRLQTGLQTTLIIRLIVLFLAAVFAGQIGFGQQKRITNNDLLERSVFALTKVMMHDVVNPPAASRFYAYALLGAYEVLAASDKSVKPASMLIRNFKSLQAVSNGTANPELTAIFCILETGKQMLPSGYMIEKDQQDIIQILKNQKLPLKALEESMVAAKMMTRHIMGIASGDSYNKLSARLRYTPKKGDGFWYPTPPGYLEAVEPNWKIIRPMMIDSCDQFVPPPPIPFNKDTTAAFHKLASEVYAVSSKLNQEQLHVAGFWDCNPFAIETAGHLSIGFKKISPGGHWINIAGIAAKKAKLTVTQTVVVQTMVSIALMDAFISCWDEKYRSNRIRPETYINQHINIKWQPLLQTPPFPEYPSGHSVVSSAAAEILSYFLGDAFAYTDDSELMFEIPARKFTSFRQAANEASISRLYGGIHFRDAIENGQTEGTGIGVHIVSRLKQAGVKSYVVK
jgi:hypothetical protein